MDRVALSPALIDYSLGDRLIALIFGHEDIIGLFDTYHGHLHAQILCRSWAYVVFIWDGILLPQLWFENLGHRGSHNWAPVFHWWIWAYSVRHERWMNDESGKIYTCTERFCSKQHGSSIILHIRFSSNQFILCYSSKMKPQQPAMNWRIQIKREERILE